MSTHPVASEVTQKPKKAVDRDIRPDFTLKELIVSAALATVSGMVTAVSEIRKEFNSIAKHWPGVQSEVDAKGKTVRGPKGEGLINKYQQLYNACDEKFSHLNQPAAHAAEKRFLKESFNRELVEDVLYKRYKIVTEGVTGPGIIDKVKAAYKGTLQRYEHLSISDKKNGIWLKGLSVFVVVGVSAYSLLTGIATRNKAKVIEDMLIDKLSALPSADEARRSTVHASASAPTATPGTSVRNVLREETLAAAPEQSVSLGA